MSEFVRLCSKAELPGAGEAREIEAGGKMYCVANVGGEISVLDNVCPHRGGPLGQGMIEEGYLVCPWHAWAFDAKTGVCTHNPQAKVKVWPLKIEGDDLLVESAG
jgi:nitrite reductase (NADH) small subunit